MTFHLFPTRLLISQRGILDISLDYNVVIRYLNGIKQ
jgi:hypothetical protein